MEQYVTKKSEKPRRGRRRHGALYWLFWLIFSFLALAYTLPFLLIGGLCGLMLFARNRMEGAFAWRNKVVAKLRPGEEDNDDSDDDPDVIIIDKDDN